jgi:hypothetical protein
MIDLVSTIDDRLHTSWGLGVKTSGRYPDMIRGKRNDEYGRQTLRVDCCGWESYREAVSYIDPKAPQNLWHSNPNSHPAYSSGYPSKIEIFDNL